jgi:hypothetical protein
MKEFLAWLTERAAERADFSKTDTADLLQWLNREAQGAYPRQRAMTEAKKSLVRRLEAAEASALTVLEHDPHNEGVREALADVRAQLAIPSFVVMASSMARRSGSMHGSRRARRPARNSSACPSSRSRSGSTAAARYPKTSTTTCHFD